ncbi:MAG: coproporphyrinogen III oxidase family protein [Spirochaetales bacterium]|nr:MAG: coproporphyrinogen III oxidase family protein [Spirochaetales bacterium]
MMPAIDLSQRPVSLYVHVPFCASRCAYCDFHSSIPTDEERLRWILAVERHLDGLERIFRPAGYETLYIGGGTPSFLPVPQLSRLLGRLLAGTGVPRTPIEATMEANPEDIDSTLLSVLADAGLNRISVGVQSLEDDARNCSRRRGNADSTRARLETLASRWRGRLSADLIYGLPGQSVDGLARDIGYLADLGFSHVSLYELTLSDESPMARAADVGEIALPGEDERHERYVAAKETLRGRGYQRYEVSNWCKPGQECSHNQRYWRMGDWLALGPSGSGNLRLDGGRFLRLDNPADDMLYASDPLASCTISTIETDDAMFEVLMMALRTSEGLGVEDFRKRFGVEPSDAFGEAVVRYPHLVSLREGRYVPSDEGMDLLNVVLVACLDALQGNKAGGHV